MITTIPDMTNKIPITENIIFKVFLFETKASTKNVKATINIKTAFEDDAPSSTFPELLL